MNVSAINLNPFFKNKCTNTVNSSSKQIMQVNIQKNIHKLEPEYYKSVFIGNQCPSFGARRIYPVAIKAKDISENSDTPKYHTIKAFFTNLEPHNKKDKESIEALYDNGWEHLGLGSFIIDDFTKFENQKKYYSIELDDKTLPFEKRIVALMQVNLPDVNKKYLGKNILSISLLQTKPSLVKGNNSNRAYKGAGELSLYGATKLAKSLKANAVELVSINDSFYDAMGWKACGQDGYGDTKYQLDKSQFDDFINRVEKKYNIV